MSNENKNNNSESAYDELMGSYFGAPLGKSSDEKKDFKLNIKDLDGEFNNPAGKSSSSGTRIYKKADSEPKKKPVRLYKTVAKKPEKAEPTAQNTEDSSGISLMPAFENDNRYTPASGDTTVVAPVYKKPEVPSAKAAPVKKTRKTVKIFGKTIGKKPAPQPQAAAGQMKRTASGAVISRVNTEKPQTDLSVLLKRGGKTLATIMICVLAAVLISSYGISCANDVLAVRRDSENVVTVNIPADTDTAQAIKILKKNKLIKHKYFCMLFAKLMNYRDDNYLTGIYYLTGSMGLENMLSSFKRPTLTGEVVQLTFPEGFNIDQIAEKLEKYEVCTAASFLTTVRDVDFSSEYSFISQLDSKDKRYHVLEGYLYPDTYEFYIGENPSSVIRKLLDNFKSKWTEEYQARANELGMSVDDVITLAAIIEKEAYGDDQMPLVSSVLHNRLRQKGLYPTLQCNATKDYVDNYIAKNVADSVSLNSFNQNYNTYKCEGLPIGAICNPGDAAINAALNPADTNYVYFSHDKNKKIYLAATDAERIQNDFERSKADQAAGKNGG